MRIRGERRLQFIIIILFCAIGILFIDLIIYSIIEHESQDVYKTSAGEIMNNMAGDKGNFSLSVEESVKLHSNNEFAFIIDKEVKTVWS